MTMTNSEFYIAVGLCVIVLVFAIIIFAGWFRQWVYRIPSFGDEEDL